MINSFNPEERLPNLQSREHPIYGYRNLMVNLPRYHCPNCDEHTVFEIGHDLLSPHPDELRLMFDEVSITRNEYESGMSDFYCRVCTRPVRVIYSIREASMSAYQYFAEQVLEGESLV